MPKGLFCIPSFATIASPVPMLFDMTQGRNSDTWSLFQQFPHHATRQEHADEHETCNQTPIRLRSCSADFATKIGFDETGYLGIIRAFAKTAINRGRYVRSH